MEENKKLQYITLREASKYCDYSQEYLSLRARRGKFKSFKKGRNWVTTKEWLDEYLFKIEKRKKKEEILKKLLPQIDNFRQKEEVLPKRKFSAVNLELTALIFILLIVGAFFTGEGLKNFEKYSEKSLLEANIASSESSGFVYKTADNLFSYTKWLKKNADNIAKEIAFMFSKDKPVEDKIAEEKVQENYIEEEIVQPEPEEKEVVIQEIIKEVSRVTITEPIKEITKEIIVTKIDDESLSKVNEKLGSIGGQISNLQEEMDRRRTGLLASVTSPQPVSNSPNYMTFIPGGTITSLSWAGSPIGVAYGGTGIISYSKGDLIIASSSSELTVLATGTENQVLKIIGGVPGWGDSLGGADTDWIISGTSMYATDTISFLGIGTTTPAYTLDINGTLRVTGTSTFGTIDSSTWQGDVIGTQYGGTGTSTSDWTGVPYITAGVWGTSTVVTTESDPLWTASSSEYARYGDASTTNWDTAYNEVNSSSTNWDLAYGEVNASSSFWDLGYLYGSTFNSSSTNYNSAYAWASNYNSSSTNYDTAYSQRLQWDGGSTNLVAATGRTSLGLGTMALESNVGSTTIHTVGTIATGTWNGTAINVQYGGTGQNTSDWTGFPYITAGVWGTSTVSSTDIYGPTIIVAASNSTNTQRAHYICDGIDDQDEINQAIESLYATGGMVQLLEGIYNISSSTSYSGINIATSSISLVGMGNSTILRRGWDEINSDNSGVITIGDGINAYENIFISQLSIDGNKATYTNQYNYGIFLNKKISKSKIYSTSIYNNGGYGVYLYAESAEKSNVNNFIENNYITGNNSGIYLNYSTSTNIASNNLSSNTYHGIILRYSSYNNLNNNILNENSSYGIYLNIYSDDNVVANNIVQKNGKHGIFLEIASNNAISSNKIINNGGGNNYDGINITNNSNANIVSSNEITDTAGTGYAINIDSSSGDNNYLASNYYFGTGASSIRDNGTGTIYSSQLYGDSSTASLILKPLGNIGIGTTTPAYTLDINGTLRTTGTSTFGMIDGGTWQGDLISTAYGGTGTSTALASQYLWWGDGTGNLVQIASSTLAGSAGVSSVNTLTGALTLWGTSPLTVTASGTAGLLFAIPNVATTGTAVLWTSASTTNWDLAYGEVNASSSYWDTAYSWGDHSLAGYLNINQTSTQTIINGIPLLESTRIIDSKHQIVDKDYVDEAVTALGAYYYAIDDDSGKSCPEGGNYKTVSLTPSSNPEASTSAPDLVTGSYIMGWISPADGQPSKLAQGVYDFSMFAKKESGTKTLYIYWQLIERESDGNEIIIATSSLSDAVGSTKTQYDPYLVLDSDYEIAATSRVVGKIMASVSGGGTAPKIILYYEGDSDSHWSVPVNKDILDDTYLKITASSSFVHWADASTTNWSMAYDWATSSWALLSASSSFWDLGYLYGSTFNSSSTNYDTAYSQRLQWDGGSTNLVAATGRTSLELGTMALLADTGSITINTLGTVATGTWQGTGISSTYIASSTYWTDASAIVNASNTEWQTGYNHSLIVSGNPHNVTKSDIGLDNVENIAISTWSGSLNITTLGIIATGTWQGDVISTAYGGTGTSTNFTAGSIVFSNGTTYSQNNDNLFWDNSVLRMGVGTSTPAFTLDINGTLRAATSSFGQITAAGDVLPATTTTYNLGNSDYKWGNIYVATATIGNTITINTNTITGSGTTTLNTSLGSLILNPTSYVGIGTTTPEYILDIYGTARGTNLQFINNIVQDGLILATSSISAEASTSDSGWTKVSTTTISITGSRIIQAINFKLDSKFTVTNGSLRILCNNYPIGPELSISSEDYGVIDIPLTDSTSLAQCGFSGNVVINVQLKLDSTGAGRAGYVKNVYSEIVYSNGLKYMIFSLASLNSSSTRKVYSSDVGEYIYSKEYIEPGTVISADTENTEHVEESIVPYDSKLVGIVSTEPFVINTPSQGNTIIALAGRVPVKISAKNGEIKIGDFLTSSDIPGVAMKATDPGMVIGTALEGYNQEGISKIVAFVNPHWSIGSFDMADNASTTTESILDKFTLAIKKSLEKLGLFLENGIAKVKKIVAEVIQIDELQMKDKMTGEIYCSWIENGEWIKVKGECGSVDTENTNENSLPENNETVFITETNETDYLPEETEQPETIVEESSTTTEDVIIVDENAISASSSTTTSEETLPIEDFTEDSTTSEATLPETTETSTTSESTPPQTTTETSEEVIEENSSIATSTE